MKLCSRLRLLPVLLAFATLIPMSAAEDLDTPLCSDESVSAISFSKSLRLDVSGSSVAFSSDEASQSFLAEAITDVFNELSICQDVGDIDNQKPHKTISAASILTPESLKVIIDEGVLGVDSPESFSVLLDLDMSCVGCNTTLPLFLPPAEDQQVTNEDLFPCECTPPSKDDFMTALHVRINSALEVEDSAVSLLTEMEILNVVEAQTLEVCPPSSETSEFTSSNILELMLNTTIVEDIESLTIESLSDELTVLQDLYKAAYSAAANDACDDLARQVDTAQVIRVVPRYPDMIALQIDTTAICQGDTCIAEPITLFDPYHSNSMSAGGMGRMLNRELAFAKDVLLENHSPLRGKLPSDRKLEDGADSLCYCPSESDLDIGVSEESFLPYLDNFLSNDERFTAIVSAKPCPIESEFETSVLVVANSTLDLSLYTDALEESLLSTANRNLDSPDKCDPLDKKILTASMQVLDQRSASRRLEDADDVEQSPFPSISLASSASPSTSPSFAPTESFRAYTQYLFFHITGTCRGCESSSGSFFFSNDVSGRRLQQKQSREERREERRRKRAERKAAKKRKRQGSPSAPTIATSSCYCPLDAEIFVETAAEFISAFEDEVKTSIPEVADSFQVFDIKESDGCEDALGSTSSHKSNIQVTLLSPDIEAFPEEEVDSISDTLIELYNEANLLIDVCDPFDRQLVSAAVVSQEVGNSYLNINLELDFTCTGCEFLDQTFLFEYEDSEQNSRMLDEDPMMIIGDQLSCICPKGATKRGVLKEELAKALSERLVAKLPNIPEMTVSFINEIQPIDCESNMTPFNASSVVELVVNQDPSGVTLEDVDFGSFESLYPAAYNVAAQSFCDPSFRLLQDVRVRQIEARGEDTLAVEFDATGLCRGSDPSTTQLFDASLSSRPSRKLIERGPATVTLMNSYSQRRLEDTMDLESCTCPVDMIEQGGISEEELLPFLQTIVNFTDDFSTIETAKSCEPVSSFESAILIVVNSTIDLSLYEEYLTSAFLNVTNREFPEDNVCSARRPKVLDAEAEIGIYSIEERFIYFGIEQDRQQRNLAKRMLEDTPTEESLAPSMSLPPSISSAPSVAPSMSLLPSISSAPSAMPSELPSLVPTPMFQAFTQYIKFSFSGTCRGCASNDFLTNDVSGRRKLERSVTSRTYSVKELHKRRRLKEVTSSCFCPIGSRVFRETASALQEAFQLELDSDDTIVADVLSVHEVRPVACATPVIKAFTSNQVIIDLTATTSNPSFDAIIAIAVDSYNRLSQSQFCDPLFRRTRTATIIETIDNGKVNERKDRNRCRSFSLTLSFGGECRNCEEDGVPLLEDDVEERRLEEFTESLTVRSLQGVLDGRCICEKDTFADRAPTYTEFKEYLEERLLADPGVGSEICSVGTIGAWTPQPSQQPSVSMSPTTCVDAKSCISGLDVCTDADGLCTGANSCSGKEACRGVLDSDISSGSCVGQDSCKLSVDLVAGSDSCNGQSSCEGLSGTVANDSCNGGFACDGSTVSTIVSISSNSCNGDNSCSDLIKSSSRRLRQDRGDTDDSSLAVGRRSCNADNACSGFSGTSIGDNACNCEGCCACEGIGCTLLPDAISDSSCNSSFECSCGVIPDNAPDTSCDGSDACVDAIDVCVKENTCVGFWSCRDAESVLVGNNSCRFSQSCQKAKNLIVAEDSCLYRRACYGATGSIGDSSCVGEATCLNIDADIGSGSCRENPFNCEGFVGTIGDNSCVSLNDGAEDDDWSCDELDSGACRDGNAIIGNNSCFGFQSCFRLYGRVGDNSCIAEQLGFSRRELGPGAGTKRNACFRLSEADIGNDSCNGDTACQGALLTVGDGSCNSGSACYSFTADGCYQNFQENDDYFKPYDDDVPSCTAGLTVGNNSCNGQGACDMSYNSKIALGITIGDNSCNCESCCECIPDGESVGDNQCNDLSGERGCCDSSYNYVP